MRNDLYLLCAHARPDALVRRRGGRGRRNLRRSSAAGRLHHPAPIAGTGAAWPKARNPTACLRSYWRKEAGYCRGKGGSMHIADPATGNLGANAIVGGSAAIAHGSGIRRQAAWQWARLRLLLWGGLPLGQGVLYEAMAMAQLWKLPVVYACENNLYNEYTHYSETTSGDILARPAAFGLPAESVDGQDVRAVYAVASRFVTRARVGEAPSFLLCNTYRYRGHHVGDVNREYRAKQEEQQWSADRDPIKILGDWLVQQKLADLAELERIQSAIKAEMNAAAEFAVAAPYPAIEEVEQDVYA